MKHTFISAICTGMVLTAAFADAPLIAQSSAPAPTAPCTAPFTDPVPRGSTNSWITSNDYPSSSLRQEEEGRVRVRFFVNAMGRVESAEVVESTATPALNDATIKNVMRRGRFLPATRKCVAVPGEFTASFNWKIPRD